LYPLLTTPARTAPGRGESPASLDIIDGLVKPSTEEHNMPASEGHCEFFLG